MTSRLLRRPGRTLLGATVAAGAVFALAAPASAHVDPAPLAVQKGTTATVAFSLEHGCDKSPTTSLELRFPDGFTGLAAVDKAGWKTAVAGQVVTFSGGSLDATKADSFSVTLTAPATAGTQYIPVVQTCAQGANRWIEIPTAGAAEPEYPAAALKVTEGVPTADDLKPEAEGGTADTKTDSTAGVVVGVGAVVVVIGGAALIYLRRRKPGAPA